MKILFAFLVMVFLFTGCESGYRAYIHNNSSSPLYIKTYPSIESHYDYLRSSYYDSILIYKQKNEDSFSVYKINPYQKFLVWSQMADRPVLKELPFSYISLVSDIDTIILDSKEKIINEIKQLNEDKKRR
ncbi:MAG: hypothetical protein V4685_09685, partial [Bacteroidota bacterium]